MSISPPKAGQMVVVRNRPAIARDVDASSSRATEAVHAVYVEYLDGWFHPEADQVIWEREAGAKVISSLTLPKIGEGSFHPDTPDRLHAFLDAYRWSAVNTLHPQREKDSDEIRLVAPWHSAVQVEDYQIYPVLKSLLMPRVSLLLADDVGLGKTIEAGLIISELFARRRIRRVLVICPASLQQQWQDELKEKFHLDFLVVDRDETFRMQRTLGVDSNPWATYPRIITSMDYLRQPDVLNRFLAASRGLTGNDPSMFPWQMLLVDEAHNLFPSRFGDDSDRYLMLKQLSPSFEHKLFLTATPHNGYTVSFTGLLELLDPVRFQQKAILEAGDHLQIQLSMVRRLKSELNRPGEPDRFARRDVKGIPVTLTPEESELFAALRAYRKAALEILGKIGKREQHIADFLLTLLSKRLLSSSYAFACTWWQHVEGLNIGKAELDSVSVAVGRAETPVTDDDEKDLRELDVARQGGAWLSRFSQRLRPQMDEVGRRLEALGWGAEEVRKGLGSDASFPSDARWDCLKSWIEKYLKKEGKLRNDGRLIVFTEYKHTLSYLLHRFQRERIESPRLECIFGGVGATSKLRENIKEAFNDPESPLRILLATDTASEGINLQTSCRYVFHQEIPWNPMRLEQRNGRVDRHGQSRNVEVFHFTSDDEADLRFMAHVVKKVEQAREDLGSVGQVIDQTVLEHFTRKEVDEASFDRRIETVKKDDLDGQDTEHRDKGTQDLYGRSLQRLRSTEMIMGLSPESLARLLAQAMETEKGHLEPSMEAGVYRIQKIPPGWRRLIQETIEIRKGSQQGALPKLVFDPAHFEVEEAGRKVYRLKRDTVLVRLGHPLMRRAIGTLRRQLWDGNELTRWTVQATQLPAGISEVLLLYLMLEVSNGLRESMHQEVLLLPFQVQGVHLTPMIEELWQRMSQMDRRPLSPSELSSHMPRLVDQWIGHELELREFIKSRKDAFQKDFEHRMMARLKDELDQETKSFNSRIKELKQEPKWLERQKAELERQRRRLLQPALFSEIQAVEEQRLKDLEWEVMHSHYEQMRQLLERERERMIKNILPKRFSLAHLDLQPLAVEYLVGGERKPA